MAIGCLHRQWSATVFIPYSRCGRPGMQGVIQSSHCHGQCDGYQRSWSKLVSWSPPRGMRYLARLLRSSTRLSNEWLVVSTLQRVTDPIPSQRPMGALAKTMRSSFGSGLMQPLYWWQGRCICPRKKAWIESPIIAVNAEPSDISLHKLSPTRNSRNPFYKRMMNRTPCGLGIPCPRININSGFFSILQTMPLTIYTKAPKAWIRMWNIYVTSVVISVWCSSHPVTLEPSPSRPWPSPTWTLPCLLSLGPHFI